MRGMLGRQLEHVTKGQMVLLGILLVGMMLTGGCVAQEVESGDTVKVHYTGKLSDGTVFDTSIGDEPIEFVVGGASLAPRFEQAVIGMKPGESKAITIPADEAYGPRHEELVFVMDRNQFPEDEELEVGCIVNFPPAYGMLVTAIVVDVSESSVTLDANHLLAGEDLVFDVELVEIVEAG